MPRSPSEGGCAKSGHLPIKVLIHVSIFQEGKQRHRGQHKEGGLQPEHGKVGLCPGHSPSSRHQGKDAPSGSYSQTHPCFLRT